ncbi:MAG: T9SS type A sorting domain-containing protein [Bacteroidetes bacterium]|nr:T9SS type A sorting domain-containing protein [Bacteroidota bacterium]
MKKFLILFLFVIVFIPTKSQTYVTIPDANFVYYLQAVYPTCMLGNQMDITCPGITNAITLNISGSSISDLTGIQYFSSLEVLDCSTNLLTGLPTLPATLLSLNCYDNALTSLPSLPASLTNLICSFNQLTALPALPASLEVLDAGNNQLSSLPAPLPNSLQNVSCTNNFLTSIPTLPNSLTVFNCAGNLLTSLPSPLPNSMSILYCGGNQFVTLPILPDSLTQLQCNSNQLTTLPVLPNKLLGLWCFDNFLTALPPLPNFISELQCSNNYLTSLPSLPNSVYILVCDSNNISCFPTFPSSILPYALVIAGNPFSCLPNYIAAMDSTMLSYPICTPGDTLSNPDGCSNAGIMGTIYKDNNSDCVLNSSDVFWDNISMKLYDSTGNFLAQTYTLSNGWYYFPASLGTYTVKLDTAYLPLMAGCVSTGIQASVTLTSLQPLVQNTNFAMMCKPGFDIGVQSVYTSGWIFPGQIHNLKVLAGDVTNYNGDYCSTTISGTVKVTMTGSEIFSGVAPGALTPAIAGNVYTYTIPNFDAVNMLQDFNLAFATPTTALAGDLICVDVEVSTAASGDNNPVNNTYHYCYTVLSSYDPNMKEVYPVDVLPNYQDWFTYTIHFQNTGTAPAMNIRLTDTLDGNLDLETFQVINYSDYNLASLTGNALTFDFPGIMLPDSTSDFEGSKGFVQYRIKPKAGLPNGTMVNNTAFIYFDFNSPVITNTTVNHFIAALSVDENIAPLAFNVYPNPFNGKFSIDIKETSAKTLNVEIYNLLGMLLYKKNLVPGNRTIDFSEQPNGVYLIKVSDGTKSISQRIVKND